MPFEYGDLVETMGLEPTTSCVQSRRSSQLSYVPVRNPLSCRGTAAMLPASVPSNRPDRRTQEV